MLKGRIFGIVETRNMFCWGHDGNTPVTDDFAALEGRLAGMLAYALVYINTGWSSYEIERQHLVEGEWINDGTVSTVLQGGATGDMSSFQTSWLFIGYTAVKRMIGKKFLPGLDEASTFAGGVTPLAMAGGAAMIAAWLMPVGAVGGGYWYPGITGKGSVFAPFVSMVVENILSTIRRRKPGYGI